MMADNVVLATNYRMLGVGFRMSAEALRSDIELDSDDRPTKLTAIPLYFLASHSAELFLKSALLKRGANESELRSFEFRHNLEALLERLISKRLPVSQETQSVVRGLSEAHKNHALRYTALLDDGKKTYWPPLNAVFSGLEELLSLTAISTHGK